MKKNFSQLLAVLLIVFTAFSFSSCRNDDNDDSDVGFSPDDPNVAKIVMTTSKAVGTNFSFGFGVSQDTEVEVDWGDGVRVKKTFLSDAAYSYTSALKGSTVKVYYDHQDVKALYVENYDLTELDVRNAIGLERLELHENKLTKLNVKKNTGLYGVSLNNNNFSSSEIDKVLNDLPTRSSSDNAYIYFTGNPGTPSQSAVTNAEQKNWEVNY